MIKKHNIFDINNKVALITGTSRGIGHVLANAFLERGALVNGISRSGSDLAKHKNYRDYCIDLTNDKCIKKIVNDIYRDIGSIEILINCAGVSFPINQEDPNYDTSFKETINVNLNAAFYLSYEVFNIMKLENKGSIINVTSIGANLGFPKNPSYIASKSFLEYF